MLTIIECLKWAENVLTKVSPTPYLDSEIILLHIIKKDKVYLILNGNKMLEVDEEERFKSLINERLDDKPVQYIVNNQEFMGFDFYVDSRVLIPRPDTEILVESVLERIDGIDKGNIVVLDIGAGSGAVAIAIDLFSKNASVFSVDISLEALEVAKLNNKRLNANVKFVFSDVFDNVEGKFDVIVSNPPYIEKSEYETLDKNVKDFEPMLALKAKNGGIFFYERIIEESFDYLKKGGILAFEVGYNQSMKIMKLMAEKGYENISIIQDLSGINRVVLGYRGGKDV